MGNARCHSNDVYRSSGIFNGCSFSETSVGGPPPHSQGTASNKKTKDKKIKKNKQKKNKKKKKKKKK